MITNFNRIISIRFFSLKGGIKSENKKLAIKCPSYGRKPNIEISGLWTSETNVPSFNLKIRNLYMENIQDQYPLIEVEAGYYGQTVKFEGTITYMFTESPGPESSTVIMCQFGNIGHWLEDEIVIKEKAGFTLESVLNKIAKKLGMKATTTESVKSLTAATDFQFEGKAKDALEKLKKMFVKTVSIVPNGSQLNAFFPSESLSLPLHIPFLTTPAQLVGGTENVVSATITSLWNPKIVPGTLVSFNSNYYSTSLLMYTTTEITKMVVLSVNFHFSTTNGGNEMTLIGQVKK